MSSLPLASVDGAIAPGAEATIPVTDEGLLRGDGVFEVVRLYGGRPLALDWHLDRMQRSADGLRLPVDLAALRTEAEALLEAAGPLDALLRLVYTRGGRRIAMVEPLPSRAATARVATVTWSPSRVLDTLKTLSYGANMLATRLAKERDADEALFVTPHGRVLEGTTWSFFWVGGRAAADAAAGGAHPGVDHARARHRGVRRRRAHLHARRPGRCRGGVHRVDRA